MAVQGFAPTIPLHVFAATPLAGDADGDWLLDVFERAAGLDPTLRDSDADGVPDDEEDANGDGVPNGVAWPYGSDPGRSFGHYGDVDPVREGFPPEAPAGLGGLSDFSGVHSRLVRPIGSVIVTAFQCVTCPVACIEQTPRRVAGIDLLPWREFLARLWGGDIMS